MWAYHQRTGSIFHDGDLISVGYSGHADGRNNPDMEDVPSVGPIPRGKWRIVRWDDTHGDKGPVVGVLEPVGHDAHGRTGFLIHGDNALANHSASHGCIIASRPLREWWRLSKDNDLEVV